MDKWERERQFEEGINGRERVREREREGGREHYMNGEIRRNIEPPYSVAMNAVVHELTSLAQSTS